MQNKFKFIEHTDFLIIYYQCLKYVDFYWQLIKLLIHNLIVLFCYEIHPVLLSTLVYHPIINQNQVLIVDTIKYTWIQY